MADEASSIEGVQASKALPEVINATPEEFDVLLTTRTNVLLVTYMWGLDCPNCEFFAKRLPALLEELAGAPFVLVKVDVYSRPDFARRFGVFGIPHFLLFRDGKRLGKMSEFRGDQFWLTVIREHLPNTA
ncbi:MAG: thioredoxin family protein [Myxococcota bacterium]